MARTISIDTSHAAGSVAALGDATAAIRPLGTTGEHAARIAAALDEATREVGWRLADAELVVVVRGPGSFTGLRVGLAAAKSVAWASGAKLVGVCGFQVLAHETARLMDQPRSAIHMAFDAGRGEVYAACATAATHLAGWRIGPAAIQKADAWVASLPPRTIVSGPALAVLQDPLSEAGHVLAPPAAWFPTAAAAADIGLARAAAGDLDDVASLVPHYMRLSYADERIPRG